LTIRRLYASNLPSQGGAVTLGEAESHHVRVLRLRPGDVVELFDGRGRLSSATIESIGERVVCNAEAPRDDGVPRPRIVLMLALPKGSTLDDCVRMATELGVDEVALMYTERTVPRWNAARAEARINRLTRIAAEASAQCERSDVPIVRGPMHLDAWLEAVPESAHRVVFGARAQEPYGLGGTPEQVWCAVGPEGGFSTDELSSFRAAGFTLATVAPSILRVDTAVAAVLAVVQDRILGLQPR
jgi:16S rRNA (uracil1498-N3)-methyltransferase